MDKKHPPRTQPNGANGFGKPSPTPLQYGENLSTKSVTSPNGGSKELIKFRNMVLEIEAAQLKVGEQIAVILFEQTRLAEKLRNTNRAMEEYLNGQE